MPKSRTTNNRLHSNSKRKSETAKRKTQNSPSAASYSALKERFDALAGELRDALERESATSEILRVEGDILRLMASYGSLPTSQTRPIKRQLVSGRAVIERQTIHVHDITAAEDEFPVARTRGIPRGIRTFLATPLLRQGVPIGVIAIRRTEVRPFSDKQISLF